MYQTDGGWEKQKCFLCAFDSVQLISFWSHLFIYFCLFSRVAGRGNNKEDAELLVAFGINFGNSANK